MTDTEDKDFTGKREKREKVLVDPVVKDEAFWKWLVSLFYGPPEAAHYPERIEINPVAGKQLERIGPSIWQKPFAPKGASDEAIKKGLGHKKPNQEELVELANYLLFRMQKECDESRKSQIYGVHVWHFSRGDQPYERWIKRCQPQGRYLKDGERSDEDDDGISLPDKYSLQLAGHHERLFGLYGGAFEGLLDRMDRILERQDVRIERQDERIGKLSDMLERALSLEAERVAQRKWNELKIKSVEKAIDMGVSLVPPLANALLGKTAIATQETPETITLKNYFKEEDGALSKNEMEAVFGIYGPAPEHKLVRPGILSVEQGQLLFNVAFCNIPVDELDKMLPGGPFQITPEQAMALQQVIPLDKLAPLLLLMDARIKRRQSEKNGA